MAEPLDLSDPIAVLLTASRALRKARIEAATYGGLALAVYGAARETKDADLAIAGADIEKVGSAFRETGLDVRGSEIADHDVAGRLERSLAVP
jgi:hypothetical protein